MELEPAVRAAAGDSRVSERRRRQVRPSPAHPDELPGEAAHFDEIANIWTVETADGRTLTTRWLLTALGLLDDPPDPLHRGPRSLRRSVVSHPRLATPAVELAGKRVAVIGTGSSGVQTISAIAGEVAELTVYQRNPNWCAPLNNQPIDAATLEDIRSRYDAVFERCRETPGGSFTDPIRGTRPSSATRSAKRSGRSSTSSPGLASGSATSATREWRRRRTR